MANWILQYLLLVTLVLTSGYKYSGPVLEYNPEPPYYHRRADQATNTILKQSVRSIETTDDTQTIQSRAKQRTPNKSLESSPRNQNSSGKLNRDSIVFPGPTTAPPKRNFVPQVPDECQATGICEDLPGYPEEYISNLLGQVVSVPNIFNVDELDAPEIAQRFGAPEEHELCVYSEKIIMPRAAQDKNGEWKYVVNQREALQGFRVEICNSAHTECSKLAAFRPGYQAFCKQKYSLRRMIGIEKGKLVENSYRLPSCCSCVMKENQL